MGRATKVIINPKSVKPFQSTPSVGRATQFEFPSIQSFIISIHALRGEGDDIKLNDTDKFILFQSTPSVGRATFNAVVAPEPNGISIHALRGEGD